MKKKFQKIKKAYDEFHRKMLSKGRLLVKDTGHGYWAITPTDELFELFLNTNLEKHKRFIDLGSGDGRAAIIADLFTNSTGIELDEELHNFALEIAKQTGSNAELLKEDYMMHDLSKYDYIFIHPDKHISEELEDKLLKEMKTNSKLVVFGPLYHPKRMNKIKTLDIKGSLISIFKK